MAITHHIRRGQAISATILVAALLLIARGASPVAGSTYTSDQATVYQDFGGTIRNTGAGWYVIDDAGHAPDSITIGAVTTTYVQVLYPACDEIVSFIAAPDDTYATTYAATFGASVGLAHAYIKGSVKDGSDAGTAPDVWNPTVHYSSGSNIWLSGRCEVSP